MREDGGKYALLIDGSCAVKPGTFHYAPVPHGLMIMVR